MIEKAIFIKRLSQINLVSKEYQRLYFGEEFCERKISEDELRKVAQFADEKGLPFTYVTPFVTEKYFDRIINTVMIVTSNRIENEIVINDWGLFHAVQSTKSSCKFILGRLLNKQKKGPEILGQMKRLNKDTVDHFQRANTDSLHFQKFLIANGFIRIEMDNLLCGIIRESRIPASLYTPFAHISVTRTCKLVGCENGKSPCHAVIRNCRKECEKYDIELEHPKMPVRLYLKGNAHLFQNNILPKNLKEANIDRIVFIPQI